MKITLAVALSLVVQRALGWPGLPAWAGDALLPMAFIVANAMLHRSSRWPYAGLAVGLGWDLLMEGLIGPGAIAWSAAALAVNAIAGVVADRSSRAWAAAGALGALVMVLAHSLSLLPLGLPSPLSLEMVLRTMVLSAAWCGLVGWLVRLDLPNRWQLYRSRKLR